MGKSLKQRFNGSSQEVLDYARQFGIWKAMEQYEVKDYIAMLNFLQGMAPDESFEGGSAEDYDTFASPQAFDGLVAATQRYIARLEAKIAEKDRLIATLQQQVESNKQATWNRRKPLIENLRSQINKANIDFA